MSSTYAANVARWNKIPMARESPQISGKRSRSRSSTPAPVVKLEGDPDSSEDDNISLVSRSPSPQRSSDLMAYDEHHSGPVREVITVDTKIKSTNKGYAMLAKLGWTAGQPLGLSSEGRIDPIPFSVKNDQTGLGKWAQDERVIESTVAQRRGMDSERQIKETSEQRQLRERKAAEKEALATQIASTLKAFHCSLCDKQYQTVAQYDEHTNSYAHHHKQRFRDMQTNAKGLAIGQVEKEARLAKERKREERELKRMAKARGVRVSSTGTALGTVSPVVLSTGVSQDSKGFKTSGWATVSASQDNAASTAWRSISNNTIDPPAATVYPVSANKTSFRRGGFETLATTPQRKNEINGGEKTGMEVDEISGRTKGRPEPPLDLPPVPSHPPPPLPPSHIPPPPSDLPPPPSDLPPPLPQPPPPLVVPSSRVYAKGYQISGRGKQPNEPRL